MLYKSLVVILAFIQVSINAQNSNQATSLFDGETLQGWKVVKESNQHFWSVVDGVLTGGDGIQTIPTNTYLQTIKEYEDFEFRCLFRLTGDHNQGFINSGIQYRSLIEQGEIVGYQADIGDGYWGDIYDEHRRAKLSGGELDTLLNILKPKGWNSYIIRCKGNKHELYINGVKTNEYIEKDKGIPSKGVIAVQLHSGGNAKVEFKNITINSL